MNIDNPLGASSNMIMNPTSQSSFGNHFGNTDNSPVDVQMEESVDGAVPVKNETSYYEQSGIPDSLPLPQNGIKIDNTPIEALDKFVTDCQQRLSVLPSLSPFLNPLFISLSLSFHF